jgi:hypothetical protein
VKLQRALLISTIVLSGTLLARSASSLCLSTSFEDQVGWAQIIFAGTVTSAEAVSLPTTIVTQFWFGNVRYVKGGGQTDSLLLAEEGGSDGQYRITVEDGITFRIGSRYVVFATKGYGPAPDQYGAMPCGTGHPFGVWPDSGATNPVVHLDSTLPLVAFDGRHLVALWHEPWRPETGVWATDENGRPDYGTPPPRRPLPDLIRAADAEFERQTRDLSLTPDQVQAASRRIRTVTLFPHQDPGTRVSEEEFLRTLSAVIESVADSSAGDLH